MKVLFGFLFGVLVASDVLLQHGKIYVINNGWRTKIFTVTLFDDQRQGEQIIDGVSSLVGNCRTMAIVVGKTFPLDPDFRKIFRSGIEHLSTRYRK